MRARRETTSQDASHGDRVAAAAALGAVAGAAGALLDVASAAGWLSDRTDRIRLALTLPAVGASACALIAGLIAALLGTQGFSARPTRERLTRAAAVLALPLGLVAHLLFTGGRTSRLPAQWALQPLAALALVSLGAGGVVAGGAALRALRASGGRARSLAAGALVAAGLVLHGLDHRVLPRLYEYLHAGLGALTALALGAAVFLLTPRTMRPRWSTGRALLIGAAVLLPASLALVDRWDNVRAELFDVHAPFARHLAAGAETVRALVRPARSRAHIQRPADGLASTPTGNLPTLPGAHLLLITVDALRDDRINPDTTPALWALARGGVRFARTYAQAPHSSYSISSLHTGEYLHETVALGQRQPLPTLAETLAARGYHAAALYTDGIFFTEGERLLPYRDAHFGFARADHTGRRAREQADAAMREVDDLVRRGEPPGFLWVHFFDAHEPYAGAGPTARERYDNAVRAVDAQAARLIAYARARLAGDVVVAVTADHGEEFGEHGGVYHGSTLYEEQVRVPWLLSAPGLAPARVDVPVELVDVAPTLLALLGVPPPPTMRGRDARGLLGAGATGADVNVWPAFGAVNTRTMVVRWPFKYITDRRYGVRELYDLADDPGERRNLAGAQGARALEMDGELADWLEGLGRSAAGGAALARARMGDRSAAPALVALALDATQGEAARREAVDALSSLRDATLLEPLRPLLAPGTPRGVGDAVAAALGEAGRPEALPRLRDAVTRDEPGARAAAALALARLGDPAALNALVELLETGDEPARLRAVDALGAARSPWAAAPLLAALDDDHLRYRAVLALGLLRLPAVVPALRDALAHDRADDVRANAAAALALAGDAADWPWLARLARDDGAQPYAATALGALRSVGREVAGWDARAPAGDGWSRCAAAGDGPVWALLGTRACVAEAAAAEVPVRPAPPRGACVMVVRARGAGSLWFEAGGREFARVPAGEAFREWRVPIEGDCAALGAISARGTGPFELAHLVLLPR